MVGGEAQHRKRFVNTGEVRLRFLDDAPQVLEDLAVAIDDSADLRLEGNPTQAAPPGDSNALEISPEWGAKTRGVFLNR